jgi:hypothetical protein
LQYLGMAVNPFGAHINGDIDKGRLFSYSAPIVIRRFENLIVGNAEIFQRIGGKESRRARANNQTPWGPAAAVVGSLSSLSLAMTAARGSATVALVMVSGGTTSSTGLWPLVATDAATANKTSVTRHSPMNVHAAIFNGFVGAGIVGWFHGVYNRQ